jgi:hypothetical protein
MVDVALYAAAGIGGTVAVVALVRLVWYLRGRHRLRAAGQLSLLASERYIWRDPATGGVDLLYGPGGSRSVPVPPFAFVEEHLTGSQPCIAVRDGEGRLWRAKWGHEAQPEAFAVRLAAACGYFSSPRARSKVRGV